MTNVVLHTEKRFLKYLNNSVQEVDPKILYQGHKPYIFKDLNIVKNILNFCLPYLLKHFSVFRYFDQK